MAPSSSSGPVYVKDEKVLCFHGELLYEAKVLDSKVKDPNDKKDGHTYRVHYKGWKNTTIGHSVVIRNGKANGEYLRWDDWVPQERIRKLTEENKELAANLKKDMDAQRRAATAKPSSTAAKKRAHGSDLTGSSARGSEDRSSAVPQAPRGTKRGREIEGIDKEEDFVRRPAVRLFIPDSLKSILVDDWEKVTKEQKLATVPSPTPVTQFLNEYYESEANSRRPGSADADILEETIAGVREYFNKSLGRILLYRFERHQFYEVHKQIESGHGEHAGKTLCDMYGCEHLLRLFGESQSSLMEWNLADKPTVSMPDLIAHTNMDSQSVSRLREELSKMTQWLAKRIPKYLSTEYQHAGQEYLDSSKNGS